MKTMKIIGATVLVLFLTPLAAVASTVYSGITFPDGDVSFADKVIASSLGDGVQSPNNNPEAVLGAPDWTNTSSGRYFSLGVPGLSPDNLPNDKFGFVTVQFTDNSLTTSGNSDADLFIFEIGEAVERYSVEISKDNIFWILVATITGQPSSIDIDGVAGVNSGDKFSYVRVSDVAGGVFSGSPFAGPDIDAIGAISSSTPVDPSPVPLPAGGLLLLTAIAGFSMARRRKH